MKKRFRMGLRGKFAAALAVMCLCTTAVATLVGIRVYRASSIAQYNDTAYQVASTVADYFTDEELEYYADLTYRYNTGQADESEIQEAVESSRYQELHELIAVLRRNINANDIVVFTFDMDKMRDYDAEIDERGEWNPLYYIMDNYHDEEEQFSLGDCGSIIADYREDLIACYESGKPTDNSFVADSQFGYTVSAIYPVVRNESVAAFVSVEIPMSTLNDNIRSFMWRITLFASITAVVILLLEIAALVKTMINPIKLVAAEAEGFVKNDNLLSDRLKTIHTGDEIQTLSESLLKWKRISTHIFLT